MRIFLPCAVFVCVFTVFIPALSGEFLNWDDDRNFILNESWRGLGPPQIAWMFTTFHQGHYQPLTWLTLGLNYQIAQMNPWVYHFTNNLFHALNAVLVYWVAARLIECAISGGRSVVTRSTASHRTMLAASFAALLWGVHPLRVESVAWITERRDLVSGTFILLTMLAYLRYVHAQPRRRTRWYVLVIVFFVLSLLSKVIGVTLPVVMLVLDIYPLRRFASDGHVKDESAATAHSRAPWAWLVIEKLPLLATAFAFGSIVAYFDHQRGWIMSLADHPLSARVGQVGYGLVFYVWKSILPVNLIPLQEMQRDINPLAGAFLLCLSIVVVAFGLLVVFRRRIPAVAVAAAVYGILLAPTLGIVQTGPQMVADRYSYLPTIGLAMIVGGALAMGSLTFMRVALGLAMAIILTLSVATWRQSGVWKDSFTLWQYTCAVKNAQSTYAWFKYGMMLNDRSRFDEARDAFARSVAIDPRHAKAWFLLGNVLYRRGEADQALDAFAESVKRDPRPFEPYYNAAYVLMKLGRLDEAAATFQKALERTPNESNAVNKSLAEAHINLGIVLLRLGRRDEAQPHLLESARLDPSLQPTVNQLMQPAPAATQGR